MNTNTDPNPSESARYVVVTGASKGIGRATAIHLARNGFHVFAGVRKESDAADLQKEAPNFLTSFFLDVTNRDQIHAAAEIVTEQVGDSGLAGLVNNAGVAVGAPLEFIPVDELRDQLEINVVGQIAVTQSFLPLIRHAQTEHGCGRIINISSIGGRIASPMKGAYHASKFALEALTDSLRMELQPWGIHVVSIEPGTVATPIWETSVTRAQHILDNAPEAMDSLYGELMRKQVVSAEKAARKGIAPERVAEVIARALTIQKPKTRYLVGPDARFAGNWFVRLPDRLKDRLILSQ